MKTTNFLTALLISFFFSSLISSCNNSEGEETTAATTEATEAKAEAQAAKDSLDAQAERFANVQKKQAAKDSFTRAMNAGQAHMLDSMQKVVSLKDSLLKVAQEQPVKQTPVASSKRRIAQPTDSTQTPVAKVDKKKKSASDPTE